MQRSLWTQLKRWLRDQAKPQVILPVVVGAGLIAYVSSIAAAPRSAPELRSVVQQTFLPILALTFPYLALRGYVWRQLLVQLGFNIPWRQIAASFAAGEMTKSIPAGVYTQNYILAKLNQFSGESNARTGMATTAMLGLETLLALPVVLIFGVPGQPWVRWALIGIVAAWLVLIALVWILTHHWEHDLNPMRHPRLQPLSTLVAEFLEAGKELVSRRTLANVVPTVLYMFVYVIDLALILRALGVHDLNLAHVAVVYAASVLAVVLVPIPTEIGITEITGLSVLKAYGVPGSTAALAMLSLRLLATGLTIVVAGALLFLMRDELRGVRSGQHTVPGERATASQ
jgi:uncharacterized membrane protein YbhN (UPF0104 family)